MFARKVSQGLAIGALWTWRSGKGDDSEPTVKTISSTHPNPFSNFSHFHDEQYSIKLRELIFIASLVIHKISSSIQLCTAV